MGTCEMVQSVLCNYYIKASEVFDLIRDLTCDAGWSGWQLASFKSGHGILLWCEIPWGQNLQLTRQIAVVEAAARPLSLHAPPAPVCLVCSPAAEEILSFNPIRTQALAAFSFCTESS